MYDRKKKIWISDCNTPELQQLLKSCEAEDKVEIRFLKASEMLSKINSGGDVAQAVAAMEALAKKGYPEAMFSMGQMFSFGWGVNKDRKMAEDWYRRAADADYEPAVRLLRERKKRRIAYLCSAVVIIAVLAIIIAVVYGIIEKGSLSAGRIIRVHEDTELCEVMTVEEFATQIQSVIAEYDDAAVISGAVSTNRILLKFEGNELDLSAFPADKVIVRENNVVIIQFADEKQARECLESLKNREEIIFAETDVYDIAFEAIDERYCELSPVHSADMTNDYMSWGVVDMGLDKLSEYVNENYSDREVVVAIIDSGALVHSENAHRYIEGYNVASGGAVIPHEHGTHVTGTVLDGADCDNIKVWNIDCYTYVYDDEGNLIHGTSLSLVYNAFSLAAENEVDVINFSQGYYEHCQMLHEAVNEAVAAGVVVVQAAGNEGCDTSECTCCPAESASHIVVGAYDKNHDFSYFTNYGSSVDVCAPGEEIWSYSYLEDGKYAMLQGTSMATPHITALAALLKCIRPDATPAQIETYIKDYCRPFMNPAYSTGLYGAGAPDATAFMD